MRFFCPAWSTRLASTPRGSGYSARRHSTSLTKGATRIWLWILDGGLTFSFAAQVPLRDAGLPAASQVPPVGPPPAARASEQVSPAGPARTPFACVDLVARLQHWHDRPEHRGQPDGAGDADELRLLAARAGWLVGVLARLVNIIQVGSFLTSIASHVSSSTVWPDHQAGEATQRLQHHRPPTPRPAN